MNMTPLEIKILLHYHTRADEFPTLHMPTVEEAVRMLLDEQLLQEVRGGGVDGRARYQTAPRGRAHMQQLCSLPWPTRAWVGADGTRLGEA